MSIVSFIIYCFVITVTPGTTNILILNTVQNDGVKSAMVFAYGSVLGFGIILASAAFLSSFFANVLPGIIIFVQIGGTFYMLYLAYQIYKMDASNDKKTESRTSFNRGLFVQLLNPKPIMFALTLFPSFVLPYYNSSLSLTITVVGVTLIGFLSFILWVTFGAIFKEFLNKYRKAANTTMAIFIVYAAVMIWI